jgi:two-component system sensor histidine kinase CreC
VEAGEKTALPKFGNNEIGKLGRALEAMRNKLEGKEYVEELMHTLAHELKSPIAAIQSSAELLREELPTADRERFLANILEQNTRQKLLIDKLLALVKVEKQQKLDKVEPVNLRDLITQVQTDFSAKLQAKSIRLALSIDDTTLTGDALLLRQAVGNLLDNAIDFSPVNSKISISGQRSGNTMTLVIQDHGSGIPDYAKDRLFERFYSLPRQDGAKSTGLGLPFVREVMALHKGTVTVENGKQDGTAATIQLPIV